VRTADAHGMLVWDPGVEWTGGGFASTSADLARWGHSLFGGQAMETPYLDRLLCSSSLLGGCDEPEILRYENLKSVP